VAGDIRQHSAAQLADFAGARTTVVAAARYRNEQ
jgi:hypothetical protein